MKFFALATVLGLASLAAATPTKKTSSKLPPGPTAEEAIRTIHEGAQLGLGISSVVEINFYGGAVVKVGDYRTFVTVTTLAPLNWKELEEASVGLDGSTVSLTLRFKNPFDYSSFTLQTEDGLREPGKPDTHDKVELYVPAYERARAEGMRTAALRLRDLARAGQLTLPPTPTGPTKYVESFLAKVKEQRGGNMTAEEALAKIASIARMSKRDAKQIETIFYGSTMIEVRDSETRYYVDTSSGIPWAEFAKVFIYKTDEGRIAASLEFKTKFDREQYGIRKSNREKKDQKTEQVDRLRFYFDGTEMARAEELKRAAARLHDLAVAGQLRLPPPPAELSPFLATLAKSGPAEGETRDYIDRRGKLCAGTKMPPITLKGGDLVVPFSYRSDDPSEVRGLFSIPLASIKDVLVRPANSSEQRGLVIDGDVTVYKLEYASSGYVAYGRYYTRAERKTQASTFLLDECQPFEVEKLANAIKHLAKLSGAAPAADPF